MKYNDLEKTQDLFDIAEEVPSPIETIEMEGASKGNLTDEFTLGLTDKEEAIKEVNKEKKKKGNSPNSKKKKIILIISLIVLLAIIIGVVLFFILKDDKESTKPKEPSKPQVIIEKENYIYKDGILTFLDKEDNEIGNYKCENEEESLCYVINYAEEDNFDITKNVYEDETIIERRSVIYLDKYVFIYDNSKSENGVIKLYNIIENKEEGIYTLVKGYSDSNYVILKDNNNKYGAIEFTEEGIKEKIEFTFEYLGMMNKDSKVVAKTNDKYFIYSKDGKLESKGLAFEIKSYNNKYIVIENDSYYVYDYKSNLIFDESYDHITLLDNYAALISNQKLYIKDYKNNKYNEEGIAINNTNYNELNIYNKDKELVETKKAYEIKEVEDKLEITYYTKSNKEKNKSIDLKDGKLSANYTYLNYFDGNLYFYSDEEESNLIGTYKCNNKNNIESDYTSFSNCSIASDSFFSKNEVEVDNSANIGWIPIFNERYVFLIDSIDTSNPTIILYDLKETKTLSKYESVDTGTYTKENKVSFKTLEGTTYVMAKNKNKKYGVIKIAEEVSSAVSFNYSSLEKIRDYYMAGEASGTYLLLDNEGKEITNKYNYKIVDYKGNYVKVVDKDNKYYVYDFKGEKIEETGYLHISLNEDYYVVITSEKKLDIHKYSDSTFKLSSTIDIKSDDYANAYDVAKNATGYIIKIKSSNETISADLNGVLEKDKVNIPETPTEEDTTTNEGATGEEKLETDE